MNDRPQDDALLALLYDELPPAEAAALREKLAAESPESLERLAQWQAIRDVVAELPELEPDPQIHYDIIREARKAADAASKPSGIWAWLEQLTLTPALAGLLLVVLAAGLTLRMGTDLEDIDDTALAPESALEESTGEKKAPRPAKEAATTALDADGRTLGEEAPGAAAVPQPVAANAPAEPAPADQREAPWQEGADPSAEAGAQNAARAGYGNDGDSAAGPADAKAPAVKAEKEAAGARAGAIDGVEAPATEAKGSGGKARKAEEEQRAARRSKAVKAKAKARPRKKPRSKAPSSKAPSKQAKADVGDLLKGLDAAPQAPQAPPATPTGADDLARGPEAAKDITTRGGDGAEQARRSDDMPLGGAVAAEPTPAVPEQAEAAPQEAMLEDALREQDGAPRPAADVPAPSRAYAPPPPPAPAEAERVPAQRRSAERAPAADDGLAFDAVADEEADDVVAVQATGAAAPADRSNRGEAAAAEREEVARDGADRLTEARRLRAQGRHREAVSEFEAFLASAGGGDLDRVWFEAAESYRALGQTDRALQLYRLVAGGESDYAGRARDRIAELTGQETRSKAAGQAAPARARPAAAPEAADEYEAVETRD